MWDSMWDAAAAREASCLTTATARISEHPESEECHRCHEPDSEAVSPMSTCGRGRTTVGEDSKRDPERYQDSDYETEDYDLRWYQGRGGGQGRRNY